jgi:hypothetical protein
MARPLDLSTVSLKLTGAVLALLPLTFIFRSVPSLYFKPLSEDGFYALSVSRNLATGHGFTIDGSHLTNGFQPAITVLNSLAFLGHDTRATGVRLVLVLSWLVLLATCAVVAVICRDLTTNARARQLAPWLAIVALLSGRYVLYAFNGLETGGELLACALIWRWYQTRDVTTYRAAATLGAGFGLLILVRIDGLALLGVTVLALVFERRDRFGAWLAATTVIVAAIVSAPWWIYNQISFGHLLPTSGQAEQSVRLTLSRVPSMVIGLAQDFIPWGYTARTQTIIFSVVELVVVAIVVAMIWRRRIIVDAVAVTAVDRATRGRRFGTVLLVALGALTAFYFVETSSTWFYGRYLAPAILLFVVVGSSAVLNRGLGTTWLVVTVATLALVVGAVFTIHFDGNATSSYYQNQLALISRDVPSGALVGAGQSGTIGFFRDDVVNLDGKVNAQALIHQQNIRRYLAERHIVWLCDQGDYVTKYLSSNPAQFGWTEVAQLHGFELWHRTSSS